MSNNPAFGVALTHMLLSSPDSELWEGPNSGAGDSQKVHWGDGMEHEPQDHTPQDAQTSGKTDLFSTNALLKRRKDRPVCTPRSPEMLRRSPRRDNTWPPNLQRFYKVLL